MFQNTDMYHFVSYYPDPDSTLVTSITTNAQLLDETWQRYHLRHHNKEGRPDKSAGAGGMTDVDGLFALTFNTNINETLDTATANAVHEHRLTTH